MSISNRLEEHGHAIITGGGLGLLAADNEDATKAGGDPDGLNIDIAMEHSPSIPWGSASYLEGCGTLDGLLEAATLVQTEMIEHLPIRVYGFDYCQGGGGVASK